MAERRHSTARADDSPSARFHALLDAGDLQPDSAQQRAVEALQRIADAIAAPAPRRLFRRNTPAAIPGLYMHGGVGRGKTMLMDLLADSLPATISQRRHFHHFMAEVHVAIKAHSGHADPLERIAEQLAAETRVLCFDEFFVSDVADAMILGRLMTLLFARNLTLVATSNIAPADLYRNGLQRDRFLPAIAAIETHCQVLSVDGDTDYRLRELTRAHTYHHPLGPATYALLRSAYQRLSHTAQPVAGTLRILGRDLPVLAQSHDVAWFTFADLCDGPRAAADYIEIAREFGTVLISDVPQMDRDRENAARRFLHLVDEFYDRRVKLIVSAAVPLNQIYAGQRLAFEFARAISRLEEMQTQHYLAQPHQPL